MAQVARNATQTQPAQVKCANADPTPWSEMAQAALVVPDIPQALLDLGIGAILCEFELVKACVFFCILVPLRLCRATA